MSSARRFLFVILAAAATAWSLVALYAHMVRLSHRELIHAIRMEEENPNLDDLDSAIRDYQTALRIASCNPSLYEELGLLLAVHTDKALASPDLAASDAALDAMNAALKAKLACNDTDGKAWLDLAIIDTYREGFTSRALASYKASARVSPGESWLAEKRMLFALQFHTLLDADTKPIIASDLATLRRAHPNRIQAVMDVAGVESPEQLYAAFEIKMP